MMKAAPFLVLLFAFLLLPFASRRVRAIRGR
jgi:hypothetical protein